MSFMMFVEVKTRLCTGYDKMIQYLRQTRDASVVRKVSVENELLAVCTVCKVCDGNIQNQETNKTLDAAFVTPLVTLVWTYRLSSLSSSLSGAANSTETRKLNLQRQSNCKENLFVCQQNVCRTWNFGAQKKFVSSDSQKSEKVSQGKEIWKWWLVT